MAKRTSVATVEKKVVKHWTETRSAPVDKSKRVAYGCKLDTKNIMKGTRSRRSCNYKDLLTIAPGSRKIKGGRKSLNTLETRAKKSLEYMKKKAQKKAESESESE